MKILFISHLFPNKYEPNSGIFNLQRVKELLNRGHSITVVIPVSIFPPIKYIFPIPRIKKISGYYKIFIPEIDDSLSKSISIHHLKWIPFPKKILWAYQNAALHLSIGRKFKKIIYQFKPDLVITSVLNPEGSYAGYIKRIADIPVISIAEGSELLVYPEEHKGIEKILNSINKYCDKVIFVSQKMAGLVNKSYRINNSCVINNGYDQELFYYSAKQANNNSKFRFISVGNLEYVKGHDILLNAVMNMPDVFLTIAGDGYFYDDYARFIKKNDLEARVLLPGYVKQSDLKNYYDSADLFCLSSRSESFGIAAIEAMACGLPVVAPDVGEMSRVIENGVTGYLIKDFSEESLHSALISAMQTKWDNKLISERVAGKYSWTQWAEKIETIAFEKIHQHK